MWYKARAGFRRQWASLAAVALLTAMTSATALATAAGARRSSTVIDRLDKQALDPHAFVDATQSDPQRWGAIAGLPSVEAAGKVAIVHAVTDSGYYPFLVSADGVGGTRVVRGHLIAGRYADPGAAHEVALTELVARQLKVRPGGIVSLKTLTAEQAQRDASGRDVSEEPAGPRIDLRVVGVVRSTADVASREAINSLSMLTPGFFERYRDQLGLQDGQFFVRLHDQGMRERFVSELNNLFTGTDPPAVEAMGGHEAIEESVGVLTLGLAAFASCALLAGLVAVGHAGGRAVAAHHNEQLALSALGLTSGGRMLDAGLLPSGAAVVGAVVGAAIAVVASPLFPVGLARRAEPDPGMSIDLPVLLAGTGVIAVAAIGLFAVASWRSSRLRPGPPQWAPVGPRPSQGRWSPLSAMLGSGAGPARAVGTRMAFERGRGATAVPVRTALVGAAVGLAGIAAVAVFGASLTRLIDSPHRYGSGWSIELQDDLAPVLLDRPDVEAVAVAVFQVSVQLEGHPTWAMALRPLKGRVDPTVVSGRAPAAPDEVALGRETRNRLGEPSTVTLTAGDRSRRLRVVGTAAFPVGDDGTRPLADGALLSFGGLEALGLDHPTAADTGYPRALVRWARGADPEAAISELEVPEDQVAVPQAPSEVAKLDQVSGLPSVLAVFLALVALIAVGGALASSTRRRSRDLAVLRVLGFVRGQVSATIGWQATTLTAVAAVVGVAVGVIVGRWAWAWAASSLGVATDPLTPPVVFAAAVAAVLLGGLTGLALGRSASGRHPSSALRSE